MSKPGQGARETECARLRAENAALRDRIAQLVRFADESALLIFVCDLDTGRFVYVNDSFAELSGFARAELTAPEFDFFAMIPPDSIEKVSSSREMHLRGEDHLPFEFAMLCRDGRRLEVMINSRITDWDGRRAVIGMMTDITAHHRLAGQLREALARAERERARAESAKEELERQNVELRTLDQMKDGLLRDVSHELKTPVAKQAMQLEILRVQLGETCAGAVARTLAVMEEGIHRQQRVIRNLLDLARLESGRRIYCLGPVRADAVLARVLEDYGPTLEAAGFVVAVRAEPLTVTGDEEMLWHVLSNLVNNAVKFAAREGQRRLEATASRAGASAVVRIIDNGIGLAPEQQARAFDRFYRASASIEGSGVGLSICRSIMEGMGGTVTLESPGIGCGAVATVTLPLLTPG